VGHKISKFQNAKIPKNPNNHFSIWNFALGISLAFEHWRLGFFEGINECGPE
jgi:hypothetical protein